MGAKFVEHSAGAALATLSAKPYLNHVPVMTVALGGRKFAPFTQNGLFHRCHQTPRLNSSHGRSAIHPSSMS